MKLGLECLDKTQLKGRRVGILAHPASLDQSFNFIFDVLSPSLEITCIFNPQHGFEGVKQDNMIETQDEKAHPVYKVPLFSLYGKYRRPQPYMLDYCDVILVDLQDVGCRIYTYITTLLYLLEECKDSGVEVWILDRPNPLGRAVEGNFLEDELKSFVGADRLPLRHGLTLGEIALWYQKKYDFNLKVIKMQGYDIDNKPWPKKSWINPSPNLPTLDSCYAFVGGCLLEGTHLSEGRGTTRPFEVIGSPEISPHRLKEKLSSQKVFSSCFLRPCFFEPTFNKHAHQVCGGFQIHILDHKSFQPYRVFCELLKAVYETTGESLFRDFSYEYETTRKAFDLISGNSFVRSWIQSPTSSSQDLEDYFSKDEKQWLEERESLLIY